MYPDNALRNRVSGRMSRQFAPHAGRLLALSRNCTQEHQVLRICTPFRFLWCWSRYLRGVEPSVFLKTLKK